MEAQTASGRGKIVIFTTTKKQKTCSGISVAQQTLISSDVDTSVFAVAHRHPREPQARVGGSLHSQQAHLFSPFLQRTIRIVHNNTALSTTVDASRLTRYQLVLLLLSSPTGCLFFLFSLRKVATITFSQAELNNQPLFSVMLTTNSRYTTRVDTLTHCCLASSS